MKISKFIQKIIVIIFVMLLIGCGNSEKMKELSNNDQYTEQDYKICDKYINEALDEVKEYSIKDYKIAENRKDAVDKVKKKAERWKEEGIVTHIKSTDYQVVMTFESGIVYVFYPMAEDVSGTGKDISIYSLQVFKSEFADRNYETEEADFNATDGVAKRLAASNSNYNWKYNFDDKEVTLKTICEFGVNEFILWSGHGAYIEEIGCCLVLSETYKDNYYTDMETIYLINDGNYLVTPKFVELYVNNMAGSFLYLSTCQSLYDQSLVEAFRKKNVEAIVANTDTITTIYTSNIMESVVNYMIEGNNLETAMILAKADYGEHDPHLHWAYGAKDYAVPTVYCGGDYQLVADTKHLSEEQIQTIIAPYTNHIVAYVVDSFDAELNPMSDYGIAEFVCWTYVATEQFDYGNIPLVDFDYICKNSFGRTIDIELVSSEYEKKYSGETFMINDEVSMSVGDWGDAWPYTSFEAINYKGDGLYEVELNLCMEYFDFDGKNESRLEERGKATVSIIYNDELENDGYIHSIVFH